MAIKNQANLMPGCTIRQRFSNRLLNVLGGWIGYKPYPQLRVLKCNEAGASSKIELMRQLSAVRELELVVSQHDLH
jgi:hypothetical protein